MLRAGDCNQAFSFNSEKWQDERNKFEWKGNGSSDTVLCSFNWQISFVLISQLGFVWDAGLGLHRSGLEWIGNGAQPPRAQSQSLFYISKCQTTLELPGAVSSADGERGPACLLNSRQQTVREKSARPPARTFPHQTRRQDSYHAAYYCFTNVDGSPLLNP